MIRLIIIFFIFSVVKCYAQYLPKDNSKLNYNQIMFEFAYNEDAISYTINISYDLQQSDTAKQFSLIKKTTMPVIRIDNLPLGKKYK